MPPPVLLAVDDDAAALGDVERELCERYGRSYRVICTRSPQEALANSARLAQSGEALALVLAAQWLPFRFDGDGANRLLRAEAGDIT